MLYGQELDINNGKLTVVASDPTYDLVIKKKEGGMFVDAVRQDWNLPVVDAGTVQDPNNVISPNTQEDTWGWSNNANTRPEFKFFLYDTYGNQVEKMPTAWNVNIFLTADDPLLTTNIVFCKRGVKYFLCNNKSVQKTPINPVQAYDELVDTAAYSIKVEEQNNGYSRVYAFDLFGNTEDADASTTNLDV